MIQPIIICSLCGFTKKRESRLPSRWQEKVVVIKTPGEKVPFMSGSLYRCPEHHWIDPTED